MLQNTIFKLLLAPISLLYGLGVLLRDFFYRIGVLKSSEFSVPTISVGNLSVGGAGKTPHIEYLVRLLKDYVEVATLSRGYKRKTKGFMEVRPHYSAEQVGDEPLQFKRKFRNEVLVTVGENRTYAIPEIMQHWPDTQVILLDDAFQHLSVKPGLNVLLTEYDYPFMDDYLLPSGRLREWRSAYKRADIIIVSKCPFKITAQQRQDFVERLQPFSYQKVYFSYYDYFPPYYMFNNRYIANLNDDIEVLLVCAIARTDYLLDYLKEKVQSVQVLEFEDHHYFTNYDVSRIKKYFDAMPTKKKIIITTEKDAMRLELHRPYLLEHKLPIFALPVKVDFHFDEAQQFDQQIQNFLLSFQA